MDRDRYIEKINQIQFVKLEGIKCGDVLCTLFDTLAREDILKFAKIKAWGRVLISTITNEVHYSTEGNAHIAFLFSGNYKNREDYKVWFRKIVKLANHRIYIEFGRKKITVKFLFYIFLYMKWYKQCLKHCFSQKESALIASVLYSNYLNSINVIQVLRSKKNVSLFVTLCDFHATDNLAVQFARKAGLKTATLQHGIYGSGWPFKCSHSDLFLGYGEQSEAKFIESNNTNGTCFIKMGMPFLIDSQINDSIIINNTNKIGVVFSAGCSAADDIRLLKIALTYAQKNKKAVIVKLHPDYPKDRYDFTAWESVFHLYTDDITINEFSRMVDFTLISRSTVFVELMLNLNPVFYYAGEYGLYNEIEWCKFTDITGLENLTDCYMTDTNLLEKKMKETREYFSSVHNVTENYRKIFQFFEKY